MARVQVRWVTEADYHSFREIADQPGYYLDVLTGDIFRHDGSLPAGSRRVLARHPEVAALQRKPFLLITPDLAASIAEVKRLAATRFGVDADQLGKMVFAVR